MPRSIDRGMGLSRPRLECPGRLDLPLWCSEELASLDFDRAGEAYFSADMTWIIFQATPKGQTDYAMYVARLNRKNDAIVGAGRG